MDANLQRRVQRYGWDRAASLYESAWQEQLKRAQDKLIEMARFNAGEKVIDIACGTGLVSFRACDAVGADGFVLATDISDKMIESSRHIATNRGYKNIRFERMDAEKLDIENNFFDKAICALGLMYFPDPIKSMQEMRRVLKAGSLVSVAVWGQRPHCGWAEIFEIVDRRVSSEVCPMFFNLGNPGMLEMSLKTAGFENIKVEKISTQLLYDSDEEACIAAFAGGPVALAYHKFSAAVKHEVHSEYLESIRPFRTKSGYAIPGEFVIASGEKSK